MFAKRPEAIYWGFNLGFARVGGVLDSRSAWPASAAEHEAGLTVLLMVLLYFFLRERMVAHFAAVRVIDEEIASCVALAFVEKPKKTSGNLDPREWFSAG